MRIYLARNIFLSKNITLNIRSISNLRCIRSNNKLINNINSNINNRYNYIPNIFKRYYNSFKDDSLQEKTIIDNKNRLKFNEKSKKVVRIALVGNLVITTAKVAVWLSTGSSAILSEAIHSVVDTCNQGLLLVGLRGADSAPDKYHQYGYGKSIYFWSLVSALGTFWMGAGVSCWNSVGDLIKPSVDFHTIGGWEMWSVLAFSFAVDGVVFMKTIHTLLESKPKNITFINYFKRIRDPTTAAVLMEDGAACVGILIAVAGISATNLTQCAVYDGAAGLAISGLLGGMGIYLARLNMRYLLGQAVDTDITAGINKILLQRPSIDEVHEVQSQWVGPNSFAYKAEVDFDGTFLAAKLMRRYKNEFNKNLSPDEVKLLLSWYAEDVMRTVEQEVRIVEKLIQHQYPQAQYIELEPDSKKTSNKSYAIDEGREKNLTKIEMETIMKLEEEMKNDMNEQDKYLN